MYGTIMSIIKTCNEGAISVEEASRKITKHIENVADKSYLMGVVNGGSPDVVRHIPYEINRLKKMGYNKPSEMILNTKT